MQYRDIIAMVYVIRNRMETKPELRDAYEDLKREGGTYQPTDVLFRAMRILTQDVDVEVWRTKLCHRNGGVSRLLSMPTYMADVPQTEVVDISRVDALYIQSALAYLLELPDPHLTVLRKRYNEVIGAILNASD